MSLTLSLPELRRLERLLIDAGDCRRCGQPIRPTDDGWVHVADDHGCAALTFPRGRDAPCSRYGTHIEHWAAYAAAAAYVLSSYGDRSADDILTNPDDYGHGPVGLTVNDSPAPADLIIDGRHLLSRRALAYVGGLRHLRSLARD